MISKVERKQRIISQNQNQTQNPHTHCEQQQTINNNRITALEQTVASNSDHSHLLKDMFLDDFIFNMDHQKACV